MKITKQIRGTRTRTFFAWIPISVWKGDCRITRWLETVTVEERYMTSDKSGVSSWDVIKFLD